MQQTIAEPAPGAATRTEDLVPRAGATSVLLLDRGTLLGECLVRALPVEWPGLEVATLGPDELRRQHPRPGAFDICVLLPASSADLALLLVEDLALLAEKLPAVPVVVIGDAGEDPSLASLAACRGARGFLPARGSLSLLAQGIRFVLLGGTVLPTVIPAEAPPPAPAGPEEDRRAAAWFELQLLTPREVEVVRALAAGRPNKLIAYELGVCETTVKVHLRHVFRKLGCTNRTQAALLAREMFEETAA